MRLPHTSLAPADKRLEPVHLHAVDDTSVHLCLPRNRAAEVIAAGWGVPHQYGDFGTELLVFGPRDDAELAVVLGFIAESLDFARRGTSDDEMPTNTGACLNLSNLPDLWCLP